MKKEFLFLILFLFATSVFVNIQDTIDTDLFWHLRAAKDIVHGGSIVLPDSGTYTASGRVWMNYQWVTEIVMYFLFENFDYCGLMAGKGIVAIITALAIYFTLKKYNIEARYLSILFFFIGTFHFYLFRTRILTFMMMSILMLILERLKPRVRLFILPVFFALWANIHGGFVIGLIVIGIYPIAHLLMKRLSFNPNIIIEGVTVPVCLLSTLINPFGTGIYRAMFFSLGQRAIYGISEMKPMWNFPIRENAGFLFIALIIVLLSLLFHKNIHLPSLLSSSFILLMGIKSIRFAPDFIAPAVPLLGSLLHGFLSMESNFTDKLKRGFKSYVPVILLIFTSYGITYLLSTPFNEQEQNYPENAVIFMKKHKLNGKIFNEFNWGGYLLWYLPESQVAIDGRTATGLFPPEALIDWKEVVDIKPKWKETLMKNNPDFVMLYRTDYIKAALDQDPDWHFIYEDELTILYKRNSRLK